MNLHTTTRVGDTTVLVTVTPAARAGAHSIKLDVERAHDQVVDIIALVDNDLVRRATAWFLERLQRGDSR